MSSNKRTLELVLLALILLLAAYFRWTGLAWDNGYLFHPDERQILLVVSSLHLPAAPLELISPDSPLNPKFFAYGSFPIYLLRVLTPLAPQSDIVGPWADDNLARWVLFGRWLSGLFDLGTIILTYALGRRVYNGRVGLIAAACVALTVLHIQLSHFYAVDTLLSFFTLATLYCSFRVAQNTIQAQPQKFDFKILVGISFGLALATKITALPLVFPIFYACYRAAATVRFQFSRASILQIWRAVRRPLAQIFGITLLVFIVTQPYALIDWYSFGRDVIRETFVARGWLDYPYTRQFVGTLPFVYQVTQGAIWGMGLPLGIFAWSGGALLMWQWVKTREWRTTFLLSFALIYFITIGLQYTKYLRYLLPLLPVLYLLAAYAFSQLLASRRVIYAFLLLLVFVPTILYSLAFLNLYSREHPWLTASRWLYQNIPSGKTLLVEQWDDALPTLIRDENGEHRASQYTQIALPMYDDDTDTKRAEFVQDLTKADVIILASQRLYGSIGRLPARYPLTNRYYEKLFDGELGFSPVMTARIDPQLGNIAIRDNPFTSLPFEFSEVNQLFDARGIQTWSWGLADESFSVYDHPQPIIFQKVQNLSAGELDTLLR